jgi:arylsulfatase A-like enzyme
MWRIIGIILGSFSSLSFASRPYKPNILYILADDMGFGDVSWNNPDMKTPVLERLAREGVILDQFYAQPKCSPSRAALMTGLYPYKTSMQRGSIGPFRPTGLPTVLPTLPELLRQEGYSTHLVGKPPYWRNISVSIIEFVFREVASWLL